MASGVSMARELHTFGSGTRTVAAAGTAVPLSATNLLVHAVTIVANPGNTNNIYIGDSTVDATTKKLNPLGPGGSFPISTQTGFLLNLKDVYIDADTNGNGVTYTYLS